MENDAINRSAVYISLSDALDTIYNFDTSDCANVDDVVGRIYEAVGAIPDADVAPVVHARWVDPEGIHEYHCSVCGGIAPNDGYDSGAKYCDECGARMDGGTGAD